LGIGGYLFAKGYIALHKVLGGGGGAAALEQNVDPSKLNGEGDGRVNILLLGRGGDGHEGPDLTDTIILASIDPVSKEASLLSIPRDLYVKTPNYGSTKINAVFAFAKEASLKKQRIIGPEQIKEAEADGFKAIESTVSDTMGVPIHYHLMVDFSGFQQAVDNVGGVDINAPNAVAEDMYNEATGKHFFLNVKPGLQHMDGQTALFYARSRHTSARGDFDRSERQRALISALKDRIISPSTFSNPQKISNLISTFGNHVQTNFSIQDLQRLAQISKEISGDKLHSLGLSDPPNNYVTTSNINGLSVVIPTAGNFNFKDIQFYVRNALKDSYLKSESANIMVLNGANKAGLASEKGQELKSYGYTITKVDNAPTRNYQKTIIVDLRNGAKKYTKNYLEKRFGVSSVSSLPDPAIIPDANTDFVIILGSDQANATN
jgi:LCP family protein required for cell wall assembly